MLDAQRSIFKNFFSLLTPPNFILLPERKPSHFPKFYLLNKETR